jgi:gliding motility-associated-like protein
MKEIKKYLLYFYLVIAFTGYSQIININNDVDPESNSSLQELVEDVLINSDCAVIDNFSQQVFGQPTDSQTKSYGYFKRPEGSNFPFEEGVVLTTGRAFSAGNTIGDMSIPFPNLDNQQAGDMDLEVALGITNTNDATFIKFNFVPTSNEFNFSFLMASEEYDGNTECQFADSFAFLLREVGTSTYTNLAVLPNGVPISVTNINDSAECRANTDFFDGYNLGSTNYGGRTVVLTASAEVVPNQTYEIKIVVADQGDFLWDSAIFLEAGSFNLGLDFGNDLTLELGNAACSNDSFILDTQIPTSVASHKWFFNGVEIPGETDAILNVTFDGTYSVVVEFGSSCTSTDEIVVEFTPSPAANPIDDQLICDNDTDGFVTLDLMSFNPTILGPQSEGDFTISYHSNRTDAANDSDPLPVIYTNQIAYQDQQIFARIESNVNGNCYDITEFFINILEFPILGDMTYQECDNADDGDDINGFVEFDLNSIEAQVLGGQNASQFNITYHLNQIDADLADDPMTLLYTNINANAQDIVVRLENVDNPACYATSKVSLIVNPLPELQLATLVQCDEDGTPDGFTEYNLNEANENSIVGGSTFGFTFKHYLSLADAQNDLNSLAPFPFTNTVNPQTIYIKAVNNTTGCVRLGEVVLNVTATDIGSADLAECDDDYDGIALFNLGDADASILQSLPNGLTLAYYASANDAQLEINQLPNMYQNTTPFSQIIYVRVENSNACFGINTLTLTVNPLPVFDLEDRYVLCVNTNGTEAFNTTLLDTELAYTDYSFEWRYNGTVLASETGPSLEPTQAGTYSVIVIDISTLAQTRCANMDTAEVIVSEPPSLTAEVVTQLFADTNVIEAIATGLGDYEYSLDGGPWQNSAVFTDVSAGMRLITARDKKGCGIAIFELTVIDYPLYFTPNGDGNNDTWNIGGIGSDAKVYIFDRYGKLLKQLSPTGQGWNGTFNGTEMPTSDYWFTVVYAEPRTGNSKKFKAHFTLKR